MFSVASQASANRHKAEFAIRVLIALHVSDTGGGMRLVEPCSGSSAFTRSPCRIFHTHRLRR